MRGGKEMHYVAVPGADGIVVRLGIPLSEVNETVAAMQRRLLVTSAVAIVVALALGLLASRVTSQLAAERDHLSAILAGMVEGVIVFDDRGHVMVVNPAVHRILGGSPPIIGATLEEVVTNDEARALIEACMRGKVMETELEITDKRGASLAVYVRPLPASAGGAVVAVLRDQTALRRLMTVRRDFVANVSHELRTPVTAIQGYAETLLRGKTDDRRRRKQFLEIVHRQALRLGGLVEQLLALSELESRGKGDIAREEVSLVSVAQARRRDRTRARRGEERARHARRARGRDRPRRSGGRRARRHQPRRQRHQVRERGRRGEGHRRARRRHREGDRERRRAGHRAGAPRRASSSASTASTRAARASTAAQGSGSRSSSTSSSRWTARSTSRARSARARASS